MTKIKEEVLPSKRKKNKNYRKPNFLNNFERSIFDERDTTTRTEIPNFDNIRQRLNPETKEKIKNTLDSMALKMILSIEVAIMKYIKENS